MANGFNKTTQEALERMIREHMEKMNDEFTEGIFRGWGKSGFSGTNTGSSRTQYESYSEGWYAPKNAEELLRRHRNSGRDFKPEELPKGWSYELKVKEDPHFQIDLSRLMLPHERAAAMAGIRLNARRQVHRSLPAIDSVCHEINVTKGSPTNRRSR